ncbi:Binding-protein-dependent transport systems inner membrane component [Sulfitobacter geojensis]|nr:Binding-protein-dependent transport systems inner membrane component [Sulfitobacter geojensis]NYI30263.1 D-methionine transport system permease protein [Sulfitobacter geojensis]
MIDALVEYGPLLKKSIWETLLMVGITMVVAIVVGGPLGLLLYITGRGGLKERRWLNETLGYAVNVLRSFPFIILLVVLIPVTRLLVGTSIGPRAAAVGLSVAAIPFFARLVEQSLREVPRGVVDAAIAGGASHRQIVRLVLLPEAMPALVSSLTVTAISFIAYSAVAGAIGAGGIGDLAIRYGYYRFETEVMIWCVIVMFILVQLTQWLGTWAARAVDKR